MTEQNQGEKLIELMDWVQSLDHTDYGWDKKIYQEIINLIENRRYEHECKMDALTYANYQRDLEGVK